MFDIGCVTYTKILRRLYQVTYVIIAVQCKCVCSINVKLI